MEIDDAVWRQNIQRLVAALPAEFTTQVLRVEAREFLKKLISFLPPKTQTQGRAAVARDVGRTMRALDARTFRDPGVRQIILSGDVAAIQRLVDVTPGFAGMIVELFRPELHTSRRTSYGRVSGATPPALVPQPDLVKNYTKAVQGRVGLLKSGYSPAAAELGVTLPGWVTRHSGSSLGGITITTSPTSQVITITNRSGKWPDHARMARDSLRSRAEAIKTKTLRVIEGKAVNLGFKA